MTRKKVMVTRKKSRSLLRKLDIIFETAINSVPYSCFAEKQRYWDAYNCLRKDLGFKPKKPDYFGSEIGR